LSTQYEANPPTDDDVAVELEVLLTAQRRKRNDGDDGNDVTVLGVESERVGL
jgi:hypothetical protein